MMTTHVVGARSRVLAPRLAPLVTAALVLLGAPRAVHAQDALPTIAHPVTDLAGVLSTADEDALARQLIAHRAATGVQIAVLTVPTTGGVPIEDYSRQVAARWRGGAQGVDNGVLFTLAVRDRHSRIEVGYGLEASVPDAVARRMLDGARPQLRAGDLPGAVRGVVGQLIARTGGRAPDPTASAPASPVDDPVAQQLRAERRAQQRAAVDLAEQQAQAARAQRETLGAVLFGLVCALSFGLVVGLLVWLISSRGRARARGTYRPGYYPPGPQSGDGRRGLSNVESGALGFGAGYLVGSSSTHHHDHHDSSSSSSWGADSSSAASSSGWDSGSSSSGSSSFDSGGGGGSSWDSGSSSSSNDSGWSGGGGDFGGGGASGGW